MRRRTIHFVAFALPALLVLNGVGFAAGSPKKPWQWTAEERAAVLRDSTARTERVRAYEQKGRAARVRVGGSAVAADVIDGNEHPELYFPTQLFEHMVRVAFAMPPGAYRHVVLQRSTDLFSNKADWDRFVEIASPYAQVLNDEKTKADALDKHAVSAIQGRKCAAEAAALRQERRAFGKERFDRMLYEAVAPTMVTTFSVDTDFATSIGKTLEREERCR